MERTLTTKVTTKVCNIKRLLRKYLNICKMTLCKFRGYLFVNHVADDGETSTVIFIMFVF